MRLEVFKGFELVDMIYSYKSFTHNRMYAGAGDFTLVLNDFEQAPSLKRDNIIVVNNEAYMVENLHMYRNGSEQLFEVSGRGINSILDRRVVQEYVVYSGKSYETAMYELVEQNFISPYETSRKIDRMQTFKTQGFSSRVNDELLFETTDVLSILNELSALSGLGFRINYLPEQEVFAFEVYQGRDLTQEVFFSEDFHNITDVELYEVGRDYRNVGYWIYESGEPIAVGTVKGLDRREFILSQGDFTDVRLKLNSDIVLVSCEGRVLDTSHFEYRTDWDLGDTVSFYDNTIGFSAEKPVMEVTETYSGKFDIDVVFGDRIPTVYDKLKKGR